MPRIIEAVEVLNNTTEGPDYYKVGRPVGFQKPTIADIIEHAGIFYCYDEEDNLLLEIRNCSVVVYYAESKESEVVEA